MKKHSVKIFSHPTSFCLEDEFWDALQLIAKQSEHSLSSLIEYVDETREGKNLSSALRVFILQWFQKTWARPPFENFK
jgi:predicted DNA-binding ribbon-helix-helix protein